jgi:threonine/homoserine/homoserine lactone efflux protein
MRIISQILEIFALGLILGTIPGPMLTAVFTEVAYKGFWKGFKVVLKGLAAETIVAGFILLTLFSIDIPQYYFHVISLVGTVFLTYLSQNIWKIDRIGC